MKKNLTPRAKVLQYVKQEMEAIIDMLDDLSPEDQKWFKEKMSTWAKIREDLGKRLEKITDRWED